MNADEALRTEQDVARLTGALLAVHSWDYATAASEARDIVLALSAVPEGASQPTYAEHMAHAARCPQCQLNAAAADAPPDPEAIGAFVRTLTGGPFRTDADEVRRFWPTSA